MDLTQILPNGFNLLALIVSIIVIWQKMQNKVETLEAKDAEQGRQLFLLWAWKDTHEKEASENRLQLQKEMAKLEGAILVTNEQFKHIISMFEEIKERLSVLEKK